MGSPKEIKGRHVDQDEAAGSQHAPHFPHRLPGIVFLERVEHVEGGGEVGRLVGEGQGGHRAAHHPPGVRAAERQARR
jgi:hypothetical protein